MMKETDNMFNKSNFGGEGQPLNNNQTSLLEVKEDKGGER